MKKKTVLTKFRGIKINDFELPNDFNTLNKKEKKKFILDNKNRYRIFIFDYQTNLITLINNYRKKNNIDELIYDKEFFYKDLIIDTYSEPILVKNENIFKLSNTNYLFKYPVGEFKKKFNEKNIDIINILLKDNLEKITIIEKDNIEFINIFKPQRIENSFDIYRHIILHSEEIKLKNREHKIYTKSKYFEG